MTHTSSHFLREIIQNDLATGKHGGKVVTRFPPEPNGYLHIGHAKAICIDFGLAADYGGVCHLRFDDTNPETEKTEYVQQIQADIRWLGFDWGEHLYYASDYFGRMYELALNLIRQGKAYVDHSPEADIRTMRGTVSEPGTPSPYRNTSAAHNLAEFERMKQGHYAEGACVLRAKIDLANPNMLMRDPVIYRIRKLAHHRAGSTWVVYPLYDFAHCLEDAIEGITHSFCTLEFQNNRELYDWFLDQVYPTRQCHQYEFARLNVDYLVTSKRKLKLLVDQGKVAGWDDPRMPTLAGLRRRGVPPQALRTFVDTIGVSKANTTVEYALLEHVMRDTLNTTAPRRMAVADPIEVVITNWPTNQVDWITADDWPHDVPGEGTRQVPFSGQLYIERADFRQNPPKNYYRLAPGREVRLRYGYLITCQRVETTANGEIIRVHCTYDPDSRGGNPPDGRKVPGTLHWVSKGHAVHAAFRLYDRLFKHPTPGSQGELLDDLNPNSVVVAQGFVEPSLAKAAVGAPYQFERLGYFVRDPSPGLVFNRTVTLKDSWATKAPGPKRRSAPAGPSQPIRSREAIRAQAHAADPQLAERYQQLVGQGVGSQVADALAADAAVFGFYERALALHKNPVGLANWTATEVLGLVGERTIGALPFGPAQLAALVRLIDDGTLGNAQAKQVFAILATQGGEPTAIVKHQGLDQLSDPAALQSLLDTVLSAHPNKAAQLRDNPKLVGFFVGQVLKASKGRANPKLVNDLLRAKLGA